MQTYSLQESKLLDPSHNHPSPPTVFAISSNFHLLLSASAFPPTIHLTNLLFNTPPILLRPQCSQSAVTTAAFHPERSTVFLLAFADGSCATYDAARLFRDGGKGERRPGPASSGARAETMSIKNAHAMNNIVTDSALAESQGYDASTGVAVIGNRYLGIAAAAFVPGYKLKFVTVGQDGKCCVNDLAVPAKKEARVVDSWHVRSPATSLSITPFNHDHGVFGHNETQAPEDAKKAVKGNSVIAIGCKDGRVLLYDLRGNQLGGETFHQGGTRVVDVEWMSGEDSTGRKDSQSGHRMPKTPLVKGKSKRVGSVLGRSRSGTEEIISIMDGTDEMMLVPARNSSVRDSPAEEHKVQRDLPATVLNHMDLFSPIKVLSETKAAKRRTSREYERDSEDSETTIKAIQKPEPRLADNAFNNTHNKHIEGEGHPHEPLIKRDLVPPIPQRPAPGKVNDVLVSRAETTPEPRNSQNTAAEGSKPTRGLGLFAPYMKPKIIAKAASSGGPKNKASLDKSNSQSAVSTEAIDENLWTDIMPEPLRSTHAGPRKSSTKRNQGHNKSTAFSSGPSEASNDTVLDWAAASSRPPNPVLMLPPSTTHAEPSKISKKGHISPSPSFTSDDTMVQWSSFKKKSGFKMHADRPELTTAQSSSPRPSPTNQADLPPTQPLTEATHNPKVNPKSPRSQTKTPLLTACPPALIFSSPQLQAEFDAPKAHHHHHHDGGLQQTNNMHPPPRTEKPPTPPPPPPPAQAEPPGDVALLSSILHRELQALRAELIEDVARQLAVQRSWFDAQLAASRDERRTLEEENRMLRGKLVVERRLKG